MHLLAVFHYLSKYVIFDALDNLEFDIEMDFNI